MEFNTEQDRLIHAPVDQLSVGAAAAGSGKTTTLVGRASYLLTTYDQGNLVIISFTRQASEDLRQKLEQSLTEDQMKRVITGTYHSVMARFLRLKAIQVGLQPNFTIVDESSAVTLYSRLLQDYAEAHPDFQGIIAQWFQTSLDKLTRTEIRIIAGAISFMVNNATPEDLLTGEFHGGSLYARSMARIKHFSRFHAYPEWEKAMGHLYALFKDSIKKAREMNVVTYDLILFLGFLMGKHHLLDSFQQGLLHVIVDEFQDTNYLQERWAQALSGGRLTVIGDVDQSIYSFRGGRPEIMDSYTRHYPVYPLSTNYRSLQPILDIGNGVIAANNEGSAARSPMKAARHLTGSLTALKWYHTPNDQAEANHILRLIDTLHANGVAYKEMAILVRSRLALPVLNKALKTRQVPVNDTTKMADFMTSEVVVDLMNFIKIFTNPKDIYAFISTLDRPKRGIGPVALTKIEHVAQANHQSVMEFICSDNLTQLTAGLQKKVKAYHEVYTTLMAKNKEMTLYDAVTYLLEATGYQAWAEGLADSARYLALIDQFKELVYTFMTRYEEEMGDQPYTLFDSANRFVLDALAMTRKESPDGVTLSTIHGAKGLEWKTVFLVGCEDHVFPLLPNSNTEDERRMMYVATTRARDMLFYYTTSHRVAVNASDDLTPSQFMKETGLVAEEVEGGIE